MVLLSASKFATTGKPTGWYLRKPSTLYTQGSLNPRFLAEFAHPYTALSEIADITVVSPQGGHSVVDPGSVNNIASTNTVSQYFLRDQEEV